MRYGVITYGNTDNVGDDILSYAAYRMLPRIDYLIEREEMDLFCPQDREKVAVIMNGWYLHHKYNWPPSPYIQPLLVGMHLAKYDYLGIGYDYIKGQGRDFFLKAQPVGCRDSSTRNILMSLGIDAYFSGCLTLTIKRFENTVRKNTICLVDVPKKIEDKLIDGCASDFMVMTHYLKEEQRYYEWEKKSERVEKYLRIYQEAACVVTSRLHVALPCLALQTPVLLIYNKEEADRFYDYLPLLHYCTEEEFFNGQVEYDILNPPDNKQNYLKIRSELQNTCQEFINSSYIGSITEEELPENRYFKEYWAEKAKWQKQLLEDRWNHKDLELANERQWATQQKETILWLNKQLGHMNSRIGELEEEKNKLLSWLKERNSAIEYLNHEARIHEDYIADLNHEIVRLNSKLKEITRGRLIRLMMKIRKIKI